MKLCNVPSSGQGRSSDDAYPMSEPIPSAFREAIVETLGSVFIFNTIGFWATLQVYGDCKWTKNTIFGPSSKLRCAQ